MSKRRGQSSSSKGRGQVILVFGESKNDVDSIRELLSFENPRVAGLIRSAPRLRR